MERFLVVMVLFNVPPPATNVWKLTIGGFESILDVV
jgi:hypothetical protein